MKNSLLKKSVCVVLFTAMVVSFTGCSKFMEKIAADDASKTLTAALDAFYSDPVNGVADYDDSFDIPDLLEESMAFALAGIDGSTYEIGEPDVSKNRNTIKFPVTFNDVIEVADIPMGTEDEISDALDDCDREDIEIEFTLKNNKGNWEIDDMSELIDVFFAPYESLVFIDENGMPTSFNQDFFDECVVDTAWYDPLMANPLDINSLQSPPAVIGVVYFDRPMYLTFTANLLKNDEVVQTMDITVDGGTIAYCEFWGSRYASGSYTMELIFDDGVVAVTDTLSVN